MKRLILPAAIVFLLPGGIAPAQVPDQDSGVVLLPGGGKILRWTGKPGRTYFLETSDPNDHLRKWLWAPLIESGNGAEISYEVETTADKAFFRLSYTDAPPPADLALEEWDADEDGLTNETELTLQTHPLKTSTSGSGIPDGWLHAHGFSLTDPAIGEQDFPGFPGTTIAAAFASGVQANAAANPNNRDGDALDAPDDADDRDNTILWKKTTEAGYAALDLKELPAGAKPIDLGEGGHVLAISPDPGDIDWWWEQWPGEHPSPANGATYVWKPGAAGWGKELSELAYRIPIGFSITPDGTVLGNTCQALVDENGNPRSGPGNVIVPGKWPLAENGGYEEFSMDWSDDDFGETGFAAEGGGVNVPIIGGPEKLLPLSFGPQVFTYDYSESTANLKLAGGTVLETFHANSGPPPHSIEAAGGSSGWFAYRIVMTDENATTTRQTVDSAGNKHPGPADSGKLVSFASIDPSLVPQPPGTPLPTKPDILIWSTAGQTHIGTREGGAGNPTWKPSARPAADRLSGNINARGEGVKMRSWVENGPEIACLWRNGTWRKLSDYLPSSYSDLKIIDINDAGMIILTADKDATGGQPARADQPLLLVPLEVAPEVLAVNSDFDEGRIDPATGYAIPDCDDIPGVDQKTGTGNTQIALNAARDHLDGLFANDEKVTDDMHNGWFGVNPKLLDDDFWDGANVTIRKVDKDDPDTGYKESGQVRFYSKWSGGYYGISPYDFQTLQPVNLVSAGVNLRPNEGVYGASSTIPDGAKFYMEGVRPGKITLEWRLQKGSIDVKYEQTFKVETRKSESEWTADLNYQIRLQAHELGADIRMEEYDPKNGFYLPQMKNHKYIQTVYYSYMQWFDQMPEKLYWSGMAKVAGASVYAGMVDMATWKTSVFVDNNDVDKILVDFMIQGNKDIFMDMGWAHRAYMASGIEALKYVRDHYDLNATNFAAWIDLDTGIKSNDIGLIRRGNRNLLFREQDVVMDPLYNTMKDIWLNPGTRLEAFLATDLAGIEYPPRRADGKINIDEMFTRNGRNPIHFAEGPKLRGIVPGGMLSDFDDRWEWIENGEKGMLPIWLGTSTAITGFTPANRINMNSADFTDHAKIYSMLPTLGGLRDNQFPPQPW